MAAEVRHLPGDARIDTRPMVRVDQAGEVGAACIYAGQLAVMGDRAGVSGEIRHMAAQEKRHLEAFDALMVRRGVRPTLFAPMWHVAGYALGAATALLGPKAAMAATVASTLITPTLTVAQMAADPAANPASSKMRGA